ncbi:MAG TPA: hypothetical protein VK511_06965, partial [Gemmatimonadaceae bacterium]|nr:hypothetical protein [Gemmatimonadaceae bacterium]
MTSTSFRGVLAFTAAALFIPSVSHAQRTRHGDAAPSNRSAPGAHYDACKLLSIADVTPILGDGATEQLTQGGQNCEFRSADKKEKLFVRTPESTRTEPEVTFKNYRTGPHHNYTIADEKDLGDEAVSAITPSGVEIMALKQHRILYIQDYGAYGSKGS